MCRMLLSGSFGFDDLTFVVLCLRVLFNRLKWIPHDLRTYEDEAILVPLEVADAVA